MKQEALPIKMKETLGKHGLSFSEQLELLVPAWNVAFSATTNRRAWAKGGFGLAGINMKPLWLQKAKDEGANVDARARTKSERRQEAVDKLALTSQIDFERLTPPWCLPPSLPPCLPSSLPPSVRPSLLRPSLPLNVVKLITHFIGSASWHN